MESEHVVIGTEERKLKTFIQELKKFDSDTLLEIRQGNDWTYINDLPGFIQEMQDKYNKGFDYVNFRFNNSDNTLEARFTV